MKKERREIEGLEVEGYRSSGSPRILGRTGVGIYSVQLVVSSSQMQNAFWVYI